MLPAMRSCAIVPVADVVLKAPRRALSDSWREGAAKHRRLPRRNPRDAGPATGRRGKAKTTPSYTIPDSDLPRELFDGHAGLLVRTALVRAVDFDQARTRFPGIGSSKDAARMCGHLARADNEYIVVLAVDCRQRVLAIYEAAVGGVASADADFRQISKVPLLCGASGAILVHNHPSGDPMPSPEDLAYTRQIKTALDCIGIPMLDHVIVARDGHFSFLDAGVLRRD
jgi:hypothetical protein